MIMLPRSFLRHFIGIACLLVATLWSGGSLICVCHGHFPKTSKKCCGEDCHSKSNHETNARTSFHFRVTCSCVPDTTDCCSSISLFVISQRPASQRDQDSPIKISKASLFASILDVTSSKADERSVNHQLHYDGLTPAHYHPQTTVLII